MTKARKKKKIIRTIASFILGAAILCDSQSVWAAWEENAVNSTSYDNENKNKTEAKLQKAESVGTMLVFNSDKKAPTLAGVTNKTDGIITNQEYDAARDAASAIRKELREAWTQDVKSGYSGIVWTTRERKVIDDEVIERVMEKLEKCNPDDVGAMLIPGSETLADTIQTKIGENTVEIRHGYNPAYVIELEDYIKKMDWEEYEHTFTWKDPKVAGFIPIITPVNDGIINTEGFNAIVHGEKEVNLDKVPVWGWDEKTGSIIGYRNIPVLAQRPVAHVTPGEDTVETVLEDLFEWSPWFTYGYQKKMYELIKDKAYVESDEFEVSPEIQFYPGSVGDIWEAFEDIVAIGNSDFIHVSTIKNYIIDSVVIGDITSTRPLVEESFWEVYQIDESGERYNIRTITGDIHGNLNVAFDAPGTYYVKQYIPAYITIGNTYNYTYEEYTVEEATGIILDYQTKTDKASVKYTEPKKSIIDGAMYEQPITAEQCNKNWIVTPDSIRMGNNLYMVE